MNVDIEITKEEMWSKRFLDFKRGFEGIDNMQLMHLIRSMLFYTDCDKKYMWLMSGDVETRILNAMCFPEIIVVNGEVSYLLGYPVAFETFLPVEKNKDSAEERGEVIAYPYIWLREDDSNMNDNAIPIAKESFIEESYIRVNKTMTTVDFMIRNMSETYRKMFNASREEVNDYKAKLRAHLRQLL